MVTVTAIEHTDVRGKKLYYLKATNGSTDVLINVGEKTYNGVRELITEPKHSGQQPEASGQQKGGKK